MKDQHPPLRLTHLKIGSLARSAYIFRDADASPHGHAVAGSGYGTDVPTLVPFLAERNAVNAEDVPSRPVYGSDFEHDDRPFLAAAFFGLNERSHGIEV